MADSVSQSAPPDQITGCSADHEEELKEALSRLAAVEQRLSSLEQEHRELLDQYLLAEERCNELTAFQVAYDRLSTAARSDEVIAAISEITLDLIGAESFAVYALDHDSLVLNPVVTRGVEPEQLEALPAGDELLEEASYIADDEPKRHLNTGHQLIAMIPLRLANRVYGALAIFDLYSHKPGLSEADVQLLRLISTQAALALYESGPVELRSTGC
jgi:plasmid stability protein